MLQDRGHGDRFVIEGKKIKGNEEKFVHGAEEEQDNLGAMLLAVFFLLLPVRV